MADITKWLEIYRPMLASRHTDRLQAAAANRGEVFFYIPSSGHEASAALAPHLIAEDWLHLHYRDWALAYARGVKPEPVFNAVFGRRDSNCAGRRMPGFPSDPALHIFSTPTLVGNNVLQAVGAASAVKNEAAAPLVLCSVGDGATQQGDFYEGVAEAVRSQLPVLFLVEDNKLALSTPTRGQTFYSLPDGETDQFYGLPILRISGTDIFEAYQKFGALVAQIRAERGPQLAVLCAERLTSHTNADDHSVYRSAEEIERLYADHDPVAVFRARLLAEGAEESVLQALEEEVEAEMQAAFHAARRSAPAEPCLVAKRPLPPELEARPEYRGAEKERTLTMLEAMRETLRHQLENDPACSLFGQDIADPKGDVFGLTRGLTAAAPDRVRNAPLAESSILGISIGQALTGRHPVAFMQFADFLPVAYNHILSELGAMYWRTNGDWNAPVLVLAVCGGYRPGLGPYHAQTLESLMAHVPGVDVFMPSHAADAAGLLNAAAASGRPSVFLYPKSLLNDRARCTSPDIAEHFVPIGKARTVRAGSDLTLVSWGGSIPVCERAAEALETADLSVELIDLRSIFPWDRELVIASARKTGRLLIVHEDNQTCGMGAEIAAVVAETAGEVVRIARVARPDTYIPYDFPCQIEVLPSFKRVLTRACEMLEVELAWEQPVEETAGERVIKAIGSSPSDETIKIMELPVAVGSEVREGDLLAGVEADKASMEITSPVDGTVAELLVQEGDTVEVGTPMIRLACAVDGPVRPVTEENPGIPIIARRRPAEPVAPAAVVSNAVARPVYISNIVTVLGSRKVNNEELLQDHHDWDSEAIRSRTGIETRYWIDGEETVFTLAVRAARELLEREGLTVSDLNGIVCSTGTPLAMTPSLACQVLRELSPAEGEVLMQAHDVNAACSGYLYALQNAFDLLRDDPAKKIMVITAETLSPMINHDDQKTMALFGDAATASLVSCEPRPGNIMARIDRPVLSAKGVANEVLYVPNMKSGEKIMMEGLTVFKIAVRKMITMLERACALHGIGVDQLSMIVPHQANERIIEAIRKSIHCPPEKMFNHIRHYGNTSSNTVPFALAELMPQMQPGEPVGLTVFGGGFTFGAAVIEKVGQGHESGG